MGKARGHVSLDDRSDQEPILDKNGTERECKLLAKGIVTGTNGMIQKAWIDQFSFSLERARESVVHVNRRLSRSLFHLIFIIGALITVCALSILKGERERERL